MPPVGSVTAPCRFVIVNCCQSSQRLAPVDGSVPAASAEARGTPNVACVPGRTEAFVVKRPLAPRKPLESVTSRLVMPYMLKLDSTFPDGGGDNVVVNPNWHDAHCAQKRSVSTTYIVSKSTPD